MKKHLILPLALLGLALLPAPRAVAAENGKALYMKDCKECHGENGNGKGSNGKLLNPKIKNDLGDPAFQARLKDDDIVNAITNGVHVDKDDSKPMAMKPLKDKKNLSDADIKAIVAFVRSLKH